MFSVLGTFFFSSFKTPLQCGQIEKSLGNTEIISLKSIVF
jgi:hypothetical protein